MRINWHKDWVDIKGKHTLYRLDARTGRLVMSQVDGQSYPALDLLADAGVNGAYARGQMVFDDLSDKRTWELPAIEAVSAPDAGVFEGFTEEDGCLVGSWLAGQTRIRQIYDLCDEALRLRAEVINLSQAEAVINGVSFLYKRQAADAWFEYPTNDSRVYHDLDMADGAAHSCGLVGSMTHLKTSEGSLNLLFLDEVEKWAQGAWRAGGEITHVYAASVECALMPGERALVGCFYLSPVKQGEDPYLHIRAFFDRLGFRPLMAGIREGVLYSCHPHGTMDGGFALHKTLQEYARELPQIKALGVDHLWLLPVFERLDRGVYHPTDQRPIDARYGGEEGMREFADKAHDLGMTVLFDYVPHGPEPTDPLAREHLDWCSKRRDGSLQDEWHCVSFDMTHPEYLAYTRELVGSHVRRFGIDGARIDCAMGGLSNWDPFPGHRPSASNLQGGVSISRAIMDGFERMGKRAYLLPENFNPVPAFYPVTGVFYGMNLYRVMTGLWERNADAHTFAQELTRFLEIEHKAMPLGLKKLRFLGNHDTVSWVWQKQRAYESYGVEKAKALFALMFFLDGVPMIYQGDEDPNIAGKDGPLMRDFFAQISQIRRELIGEDDFVQHLHTGTGAFAFLRRHEGQTRLVVISISDKEERITLGEAKGAALSAGEARLDGETVTLAPYAYAVFTLKEQA
ncbi:MAG TPA: hypothetical protein GX006_05610 [Clostridiales bacterium]|nr:hypothetical protein [Clostridiales bacterium]